MRVIVIVTLVSSIVVGLINEDFEMEAAKIIRNQIRDDHVQPQPPRMD